MLKLVLLVLIVLLPLVIVGGIVYKAIEYHRTKHERAIANIKQLERELNIQ